MKVTVDMARCQGHARCYEIVPALFTIDEAGYSTIGEGKAVPPELEERVVSAIKACPERALRIDP